MQLHYTTTVKDQIARLERFTAASPVAKWFQWGAYFTISGLAWVSAILFYVKQGSYNHNYLFYGAFALILTVMLPALYRWYQNSFWESVLTEASVRGIVGPTTLTITDEYVEEVAPLTTTRARWQQVERVERTKRHLLIFLAPLVAIIIPLQALGSETECDAVERDVRTHWQAGKSP